MDELRLTAIQQIIKDSCRQDVCKGLGLNCTEAKCKASACWYNEAEAILAKLQPAIEQARQQAIDHCFDYFSEIVRSGKVYTNLLDQLAIKRQALKEGKK